MPGPAAPITPLIDHLGNVLRLHRLHAELHRAASGLPVPVHHDGAASTSSVVWALIGVAVWATLLGVAALTAARRRAQPGRQRPGFGPHGPWPIADKFGPRPAGE